MVLIRYCACACTETGGEDTKVPLPNVHSKILSKVLEYCNFHVAASKKNTDDKPAKTEEEVKTWDSDFVKVDQATLFELILVCHCSPKQPAGAMGYLCQYLSLFATYGSKILAESFAVLLCSKIWWLQV